MNHFSVGSYYLSLKKITIADWLVDVMARELWRYSSCLGS